MKKLTFGAILGLGILISTFFGCIGKLVCVCRNAKQKDAIISHQCKEIKSLNRKLNSNKKKA